MTACVLLILVHGPGAAAKELWWLKLPLLVSPGRAAFRLIGQTPRTRL